MAQGEAKRLAVLDIGSSKLCCLIADVDDKGEMVVRGVGHHVAAGVKAGVITDLAQTERGLRSVVGQAEDLVGETIDRVTLALNAGQPRSDVMSVEVSVAGHAVEAADIAQAIRLAQRSVDVGERALVHALPTCYSVDAAHGIRNPEGMYGEHLGLDIHLVTADPGPILNLESAVERAHLGVAGVVAAPYAAGLACLHPQEMELGAALIDIGGGTTGIAVFYDGVMVDCGVLPIGGQALTHDLAKTLGVSLADAERLKTLHGSAFLCDADRRETIEVMPLVDGNTARLGQSVERARIVEILRPRVEEILELVRARLRGCGFLGGDAGSLVLTGGASQLPGLGAFAEQLLAAPVRQGYPKALRGLADATSGPAFSVAVGLLLHAAHGDNDLFSRPITDKPTIAGWPNLLIRWLKNTF